MAAILAQASKGDQSRKMLRLRQRALGAEPRTVVV
jgi:hypothetical protein